MRPLHTGQEAEASLLEKLARVESRAVGEGAKEEL